MQVLQKCMQKENNWLYKDQNIKQLQQMKKTKKGRYKDMGGSVIKYMLLVNSKTLKYKPNCCRMDHNFEH